MDKPPLGNGTARDGAPVPCPRCQSSNTKFCYYNNHNVNQPRHFCRDCQRYWTAGGSLRNVPVGSGKRKNKGVQVISTKSEILPNIFSFHPDQGVYSSVDPPSVLSFNHNASYSYGDGKLGESTKPVPQATPVQVVESKSQITTPSASKPHPGSTYDAADRTQSRAYVGSQGVDTIGFTEISKQQTSLSLGINHPKSTGIKEENQIYSSPHDISRDHQPSENACKQQDPRPLQCNTDRDESTGCSSVTANLGSSGLEAASESSRQNAKPPPTSTTEQTAAVLNPMAALGASMCPPFLWPFVMNGRGVAIPAVVPQVDPAFAAVAMHAMASMPPMASSMPPIHPALAAAAMGATVIPGNSQVPQIDPNVMAAVTANFVHFPQVWNPYAWSLPWNAAWNVTNAVVNAPTNVVLNPGNGSNKRPGSPGQEMDNDSRPLKREHVQEASNTSSSQNIEAANVSSISCCTEYFDAFQPKSDASQIKCTSIRQSDENSESHQQPSPHLNPAAHARSAAFQEDPVTLWSKRLYDARPDDV
ncbi:hypothetical protein KP509_11G014800 [Ceratopteris richardii]|uniref:Dof-type domain-containing protein n=1 Tax=Ceratopteris richardii TaxID=49495 RepID=A0A8T2TS76_CERRI|nr:hypothetical protein KP509_11G014800 [Ceratopteris richardii]